MPNPEDRHYTAAEISILQGFYGSNADGWGSYWLKPNSNIVSWQKTVMTNQSGDILYANNVKYYADYSQLIVSDQLSAKQMHTFIHEAWHQKQASLTNWIEYVKVVGDDAKEGNYNYGAAFGNNDWKNFAHLSSEQQAEFFADYYLLKHGSASYINLSKEGGNVGGHTEAEYDALYTAITSGGLDRIVNEAVKFDYAKDNKNGHQGGLGGSSMPDDWDTDHKGATVNSSLIEIVVQSMKDAATYSSPLILDIDGDGVELVSLNSAYSVYFNIDSAKNDGVAEATGWFTGGDGALCIDLNGDGIINNSSELFGNQAGDANGFLALKAYDSNGDGFITSADSLWGNLRVWVENKVDGISETTELHTLNELSISSINLSYTDVNYTLSDNAIKQQSTFVINGNTRNIVDAYFLYSDHNTINNSAYTLDERVVNLPDLRGYGVLPDLYIAESRSNSGVGNLLDLVGALETKSFATIFDASYTLKNDIRSILFKWAGVDGLSSTSRGGFVNGQELAFLEKLTGQPFIQMGTSSDPYGTEAGYTIQEAFSKIFNHYYAAMVTQAAGGLLFTGDVVYNSGTDSFSGITGLDTTKLNELKTEALALTTTAARETFWENVVRMVEYSVGTNNLSTASKTALQNAITASDATLSLSGTILPALEFHRPVGVDEWGTSGNDTMNGSSSDDRLWGGTGNDTINGLAGSDAISGENGDDILNGGTGGDYLQGGNGNDTYKYNLGDGSDTIVESGYGTGNDNDTIVFGTGITLSNLSIQRVGTSSMLITISGSSPGQIMIEKQFNNNSAVEKIQFNDGSIYTLTDKNYTANGTSQSDRIDGISYGGGANDTIYLNDGDDFSNGGAGNDTIYGGNGNDEITGDIGDDILSGGTGTNKVSGGEGNDVYIYSGGIDTFNDSYYVAGTDEIRMASGITSSMLSYTRVGNFDLRIDVTGYGSITILGQFGDYNSNQSIETIRFADNSTIDLASKSYTTQGTAGNDGLHGIIYGGLVNDVAYMNDGNDQFNAGAGNDTVYGGNGNDTLNGEVGDDILYGEGDNDTLAGGDGADTLYGGAGDDLLKGEAGNDIYVYSGGVDTFYENTNVASTDEIRMVSGITSSMLSYTRVGNFDLKIDVAGYGSITITSYFGDYNSNQSIETIRFADNSTIDLASKSYTTQGTAGNDGLHGIIYGGLVNDVAYMNDGNDQFNAGAGNDTVYGGNGNDTLNGEVGDDILYGEGDNDTLAGGDGADTLYGGAGDDLLKGEAGNDIYVYSGGVDTFYENTNVAGADEIRMVSGITSSMLSYTRVGNFDLKIDVAGYGSITITSYFGDYNSNQSIETIRFADNSTIDLASKSYVTQGTAGNDGLHGIIYGGLANDVAYMNDGNDQFNAGAGNDTVYGGNGNDTLNGEVGDDILYGEGDNDTLAGGDGADTLYGGAGDDLLKGEAGNDIYVYSGGIDTFYESTNVAGTDEIRMVSGITSSMLTYTRINNFDLKIDVSGYGSITIPYQFWYYDSNQSIDTVRFADNSTINLLTKSYVTQGTSGNDSFYGIDYGGSNNDLAYLGEGNDTFSAGIGNDVVYGQGGNDSLSGGDGDDILLGGLGDDTLNGGNNSDTASYADIAAAVTVNLATTTSQNTIGAGLDTLTNIENLVGSAYNDTLTGDANANIVEGGAGNDNLNGAGGIDTVSYASAASAVTVNLATTTAQNTVGAGTDTIAAFENILGSAFNDTLTGDGNSNIIQGGAGNDNMNGAGGIDTVSYAAATAAVTVNLSTTTAQNTIGAGTDTITAFENILGSAYNDTLIGDANANTINGGDGNDTIQGGLGNDVLIGGNGIDTLSYSAATAAITVSLGTTSAQNTVNAGTDTVSEFENILGSSYDDTLTGDGNANIIQGGAGNDIMIGGDGIDTLSYSGTTAGVTVSLAITSSQNTVGAGTDTASGFENLSGSSFNDVLNGDANSNTIDGGNGNDIIDGGNGNDILIGGLGVDTLSYAASTAAVTINLATTTAQNTVSAGTDTVSGFENILGSSYNDTLTGDANANTIEGGLGNDILNGGAGIDTVSYTSATAAVTVNLATTTTQDTIAAGTDTITGFENILGSSYNDTLTGDANANTIEGGLGNDLLNGGAGIDTVSYAAANAAVTVNLALTTAQNTVGAGTDTLSNFENIFASAFNDTLTGNSSANTINGGAGNDLIVGGLGADTLTGGLGADTFQFLSTGLDTNFDRITDFSTAQADKINIQNLLVGYDAVTKAITDYVEFTTVGANTVIKVDRDGLGTTYGWQQIAQLDNVTGMTDEAALKTSGNLIA